VINPISWLRGIPNRKSVRALAESGGLAGPVARILMNEVPEVAQGLVVIKGIGRRPGQRTKVLVVSIDKSVDAVGAIVGPNGKRIKRIVDALDGEKVDVIPWKKEPEKLIKMLLAPANVAEITMDTPQGCANAVLRYEDPLTALFLAEPHNFELASELATQVTGHRIEIGARGDGDN
jgi:N utilization substance protein A